MKYDLKRYIAGLLFAALLVSVCISCSACTGMQGEDASVTPFVTEAPVTLSPTPSPLPAATPAPAAKPTAEPTDVPAPSIKDLFTETDDACVYHYIPEFKDVEAMDIESLGDRLLIVYELHDTAEEDEMIGNGSAGKNVYACGKNAGSSSFAEVLTFADTPDGEDYDSDDPDTVHEAEEEPYSLLFKSVDPLTFEGYEYELAGRRFYGCNLDILEDGKFAVYSYGDDPYLLFNDRLELLAEISFEEPVDSAFFTRDGKWIWYMTSSGELNRMNVASGKSRTFELPGKKGDSYLYSCMSGNIIYIGHFPQNRPAEYYYYDAETGVLLGQTDERVSYLFSPDRTKAVRIENYDRYSVSVFNISPDNLFPGEEEVDPENGEVIRNAEEAICNIKISNSDEVFYKFIDWDRKIYIGWADYYGVNNSIAEYTCYSMLTGEKISNFNISDKGNASMYHTLDMTNGMLYAEWIKDGIPQFYAWEYANDTLLSYDWVYGKFSDIPEFADEKRRQMEEKYGFNFYLGSEVFSSAFDYNLLLWSDYEKAVELMDDIDEVLSIYPEGFFEQFRIDGVKTLSIYLCGGFEPKGSNTISDAIAIATINRYERLLALDLNWESCLKRTLIHEISHWIDARIESQALFGGYSTFDDDWKELNPSDFTYRYSYVSGRTIWKYIFTASSDNSDAYFIDQYSQTYPTEDRARLFEYLMYPEEGSVEEEYLKTANLQGKLEFYFGAIRKSFDTSLWPERTVWEEKLDGLISERIKKETENTEKDPGGNKAEKN